MIGSQRVLALCLIGPVALACNRGREMPVSTEASGSLSPWNKVKVPGMELFVQRDVSGYDAVPVHGVARITGSRDVLKGKAAFDAARSRTGDDPTTLAALAMLFLDDQSDGVTGHMPWTAITHTKAPEEEALAAPPRLLGPTLEYWRSHAMLNNLVRCRLTLASGEVTGELAGQLLHEQQLAADPYKLIDQELATNDSNDWRLAVADLMKIGDDKARSRLIDLALNADWPQKRQAAVEALGSLPGPRVMEALQRIQQYDKSEDVSSAAFRALAQLKQGGRGTQ
jgi:hypothetical protein